MTNEIITLFRQLNDEQKARFVDYLRELNKEEMATEHIPSATDELEDVTIQLSGWVNLLQIIFDTIDCQVEAANGSPELSLQVIRRYNDLYTFAFAFIMDGLDTCKTGFEQLLKKFDKAVST